MSDHGARLSYREMFKSRTYVVMITFILQDSPDMMLTFSQLMDRLEEFVSERPKSFKSVIRNLLSSTPCFSKVNRSPVCYWKLDHSKITERMVRCNFKGILEWFPELTKVSKEMLTTTPPSPPDYYTTLHSPAWNTVNTVRCEMKFSSSFSIDSILNKDNSSGLGCKEKSSVSVKVEQEPSWSTERTVGLKMKFTLDSSPVDTHLVQCAGDSYSIHTAGGSPDHGLSPRPTKRMCMSPLSQQEKFNKCKTYLAKIAFVLQDAPGMMLTNSQVMEKLEAFGVGRTRYIENNIRVNLSAKKCFVKVPIIPGGLLNNWKLDHSEITEKQVCRHFEGILDLFPELTSTVRQSQDSPGAAACKAVSRCEVKQFSSSFSIDSILKKDSGLSE